jgi:hypothetical protein
MISLYTSTSAGRRVENLTPATAALLEMTQPGEEVLIEGHISDRNPVHASGFVAYMREERSVNEDNNTGNWSVRERVTPPLLLELPGGWVRVENDDYDLVDGQTVEEQNEVGSPSDRRYRGLKGDDPVIAVGVLVAHVEYPRIEADFIARGTRESYVARRHLGGNIFWAFSIVVAGVGGFLLLKKHVMVTLQTGALHFL